ncbi:restriction endonuclease subunit S [Bacteroides acidifaciens]|uniref:restriction endonuclease subunit S n=2 Tax=Bacteroides acidifaciens TaxID=85831 RepID=UPI0025581A45|nr:restriction endonuclease subunit S [Bacteroides acidifaciens]
MNEFQLSDCCSVITDGDHAAPPKAMEGIPFITIRNFDGNNINFTNTMYVPEGYYDKLKSSRKAQKNDILYSVVGSFGIPIIIKDNQKFVFQRHIALLRPNLKKVVPSYLFHLMRSSSFYALADVLAVGSAQRTISLSALRKVKITLPSLEIQAKTGKILSIYDELIEVNHRRIAILEEMATRTYREWFVHFRFPGHESCEFENGIPKGWKYCSVTDILDIRYGKDHKDIEYGDFPIYGSGGIMRKGNRSIYKGKSVLIPRKGTLNNIMLVEGSFWCIDTMFYSIPKIRNIENLVYFQLSRYDMDALNSGTALPSMTTKILSGIKVVVPTSDIRIKFDNFVDPIFTQISILRSSNYQLQQMRDRLLPQLMSGQLEI